MWEEYKTDHPDGYRHTQFFKHFRQYANQVKPVMHIEHKAGDKMYIDFAGKKLHIVDAINGEVKEVEVFAAILGCSQLTYVQAIYSQKKEDLIRCCEHAVHYFGGVPMAVVPDNLKSAVNKSCRYEPLINESMTLLEIIEDRLGKRSTIFASQLPVKQWCEVIGEKTVADAILDRIVHDAHLVELRGGGESLRKTMGKNQKESELE